VIPAVTVDQMREVDRLMIEELQIGLLQMMENAGRSLAEQARRLLGSDVRGAHVGVLAGRGGNGGGGLAAARRLRVWGADVTVILGAPRSVYQGVPLHQLAILDRMGLSVRGTQPTDTVEAELRSTDLVLDALIGYSLRGAPREPLASLIRAANLSGTPTLALDIPSGLNGDSGEAHDPTIRAVATLTLALPKVGLTRPAARSWVGDLYLADISVPEAVYERLGLGVGPIFSRTDIVDVPPSEERESQGSNVSA
jgi:NAD(P)H-hydrate epimerase